MEKKEKNYHFFHRQFFPSAFFYQRFFLDIFSTAFFPSAFYHRLRKRPRKKWSKERMVYRTKVKGKNGYFFHQPFFSLSHFSLGFSFFGYFFPVFFSIDHFFLSVLFRGHFFPIPERIQECFYDWFPTRKENVSVKLPTFYCFHFG